MSLIKNTIEVECFIQSLENLTTAKVAHDKARDSYEGYSWGYHGRSYVEDVEKAAEEFNTRLSLLIDSMVNSSIESKVKEAIEEALKERLL